MTDATATVDTETAKPVETAGAAAAGKGTAPASPQPGAAAKTNGATDPAPEVKADPAPEPETDKPVEPTWREDWREAIAKDDEKELARLRRFASFENYAQAQRELHRKLSAGQYKPVLPENPTKAELAEYQKAHGVPEAPEGYGIEFPKEFQADDAQKADLAEVLKTMHEAHIPTPKAQALVQKYFELEARAEEGRRMVADQITRENREALASEYGREFKKWKDGGDLLIAKHAPPGEGPALTALTLADGTKLGDNPTFFKFLASLTADRMTEGELAAAQYVSRSGDVNTEYQAALKLIETDPNTYWSEAHQNKLFALAARVQPSNQ